MAIPGYEFLSAHFSNNERTVVQSWWKNGNEKILEYIEAKDGDRNWENLLTHIDIDALHEATYEQIRRQDQAFIKDVKRIVKKDKLGVVAYNTADHLNNKDTVNLIVEFLFGDKTSDEKTEKAKLFMFKLKLLEVEAIKNSKKRGLKAKIRRSKTLLNTIKAAIEILDYK